VYPIILLAPTTGMQYSLLYFSLVFSGLFPDFIFIILDNFETSQPTGI